ncbi:DUF4876 domain-containing protein [Pedobacter sp.]|uniref:DUF4876 domain-containing protein n=1 Tax=Pedobacter sp. TaxID=1411316 RepID=UPI0031D96132
MKNVKIIMSAFLALTILFNACKKSDSAKTTLTASIVIPTTLEGFTLKSGTVTFKEVNSGRVSTSNAISNNTLTIALPSGSYNIVFEGEIESTTGEKVISKVRGVKDGVIVNGASVNAELSLFLYKPLENFVIKEVFFTGTVTKEGKTYNGDKYFIIYNNSDKVLYADSLMIAESEFLTTTKRAYTPDVMSTDFTSKSIVMIPGTGKTYPVQPGASITIANNAMNHLVYNDLSVDLRNADFELTLLSSINVDNPQVQDLENISGYMTMHNRGFKSYVIAKMQGTKENFLTKQVYNFDYVNSAGKITTTTAYKIPNSWVLDAVNLSVEKEFNWIVTSPVLDMGWTYCGKVDSDATRYGKSVIRRVAKTEANGRIVLQDTNNSKDDFIPESKPSLFK